ncbi:hypothetical protein EXIGLDRAFT_754975 [Exidia glandulosa HHB12029]|uniref:F-box domain-containing protein n=1 Tax=Exidia glandulosa HHB12029 TaxID=1314781 RepID=A0A165CG29_EXIGL|nr:hypothetical protein EXIGLDRAFT_754975 [Exidia glandulosa HHB12029]
MGQALPPGLARFTTLPLLLLGPTLAVKVEPVDMMLPQHIQYKVLAICRAAMAEAHKEDRMPDVHSSLEAVALSVLELVDRSIAYRDSGYSAERRRRLMVLSDTLRCDVAATMGAAVSDGARTPLIVSFVLEHPTFAAFLETLNLDVPVNRIHSEILAHIFAELDWIERFKTLTVCRLWRRIALDEFPGSVWRRIDTSGDGAHLSDYPGGLSRVQALSRSSNLSLNLVTKGTVDESEIVRCGKDGTLRKVFAQCAHLRLTLAPFSGRYAARAICKSLSQKMPRLRTFSLVTHSDTLEHIAKEMTAQHFSGGAPQLQLVKWQDGPLPPRLTPGTRFSAVTQLVFERMEVLLYEPLREMLAFFPALRHLTLCPYSSETWPQDRGGTEWTLALPAQLEDLSLRFYGSDWDYLTEIAAALKRVAIPRVWIQYSDVYEKRQQLYILKAWKASSPSTVTNMRFDHVHRVVHPDDCDEYWLLPRKYNDGDKIRREDLLDLGKTPFMIKELNVCAWTGEDSGISESRPCHAILGLPAPLVRPHCAPLVLDLTHLSLDETLLGFHREFPLALPKLEVLTIGVLSPLAQRMEQEYDERDASSSVFFLPREGRREYVFPALRVLKLAVTWHEADGCVTRVAPEVVHEFIEDHVQYNALRLEKLVLRGVYVLETIPAEIAALLAHFEDVEWEGPRLQPESTGPMRDMWFD